MTQESVFGFLSRPFQAAPQDGSFVSLEPMVYAIEQLADAACKGDGIGVLTAVPGAGKTVVCRELAALLEDDYVTVLLSSCSFPTRRSMLQAILYEMKVDYAGLTEQEARLKLLTVALDALSARAGVVLIVDEAQQLSPRLLEELRCLTNHVEQGQPLIRVILSGQLPLEERLTLPELQALNYRITCHTTLEPLSFRESADYVDGRLTHVGRSVGTLFTNDALEIICRVSDGSPRCLNQIADACLSHAAETGNTPVAADVVRIVLQDLKQLPLQWNESVCDQLAEDECDGDGFDPDELDTDELDTDCFGADDEDAACVTTGREQNDESQQLSPVSSGPDNAGRMHEQSIEPSWSSGVAAIEVGAGDSEVGDSENVTVSAREVESGGVCEQVAEVSVGDEPVSVVIEVGAELTLEFDDTPEDDTPDGVTVAASYFAADERVEASPDPVRTDVQGQTNCLLDLPVDDRYAALDRACEGQRTHHTGRVEPIAIDWKEDGKDPVGAVQGSQDVTDEQPSLQLVDDDLPTDERIDQMIQTLSDVVATEISRDRSSLRIPDDAGDLVDSDREERLATLTLASETAAECSPGRAETTEPRVETSASIVSLSDVEASISNEAVSWRATPDPMAFDVVEPACDDVRSEPSADLDGLVEEITQQTLSVMEAQQTIGPPASNEVGQSEVDEEARTVECGQMPSGVHQHHPAERPYMRLFSQIRRMRTQG